jgi:K+-sensing histidine kinase KdpD
MKRTALYMRVSTLDQHPETQLYDLRQMAHSTIAISFTKPSTSLLQIVIQDEGPGIAIDEYTKVFDRFFTSSDNAIAKIKGVGLGLSITKLIIERAGGSIKFDEDFGNGAKCLIDLSL